MYPDSKTNSRPTGKNCKTSTNSRGPYECVDNIIQDQYGQKTEGGIDRSSPSTLRGDGNTTTYERAEEA
jgi:hypothetical protein